MYSKLSSLLHFNKKNILFMLYLNIIYRFSFELVVYVKEAVTTLLPPNFAWHNILSR